MKYIRAKKRLGQHFLKDENIAVKVVNSLSFSDKYSAVLEIGPGTGVLTKYLLEKKNINFYAIEIDRESAEFLRNSYPEMQNNIIEADFLKFSIKDFFKEPVAIVGNFPYNISSQILFAVLENRQLVPEVVGMFQKEVAQRITSPPDSKNYGILSVLVQAYYDAEYLLTVSPSVFVPPPKVESAVIKLTRNSTAALGCDEKLFFATVKKAFNQRRKMISNSLSIPENKIHLIDRSILNKRAENLNVKDFVNLTNILES